MKYSSVASVILCASGVLTCIAPLSIAALEYRLSVGHETARTDNVGRTSNEETADWVHRPNASIEANHETAQLSLAARYQFERRIYTENVFRDRNRLTGNAALRWQALPERLQISLSNSRTEATINSIQQDIENNRQLISVTSIGPKLFFRPRTSDRLSFEFQYSDVAQEDSRIFADEIDTDSQRSLFAVAYELGLSENRSLTLKASRDNVEFDDALFPELDIDNASLTYASLGEILELNATAGYTDITRGLGRSSVSGMTGNIELLWRPTGNGEIRLGAKRNLNDQSDDLRRGAADFGQGSVIDNSRLNEVFEEDTLGLNYTHRWGRNIASIGYEFQSKDYTDSNRDQDESGIRASFARRLTPQLQARISAERLQRDFKSVGLKDDYLNASAVLNWQAGRKLRLYAGVSYEERDSSSLLGFSFDELVFRIGLNYDLVNQRQRAN